MSSFKRKTAQPTQKTLNGTKLSPAISSVLLTSSGIPSLDDILGGGIQLGTDLLILNSDPHSAHSDLIQKHFIAQGIAAKHDVHVLNPCAKILVESCMWSSTSTASVPSVATDEPDAASIGEDKVKIAWRYERMQKFKTTVAHTPQEDYCQSFDLTSRIPSTTIDATLNSRRLHLVEDIFGSDSKAYDTVYEYMERVLRLATSSSQQNVVRFSIPSFANIIWGDWNSGDIVRFLLRLRLLLRENPLGCVLLTSSSYTSGGTHQSEVWIEKLGWSADACLSLNSFTSDPSMAAMFPSHHGLLTIHNLPRVQVLVPASDRFSTLRGLSTPSSSITSGGVGENNLAYKCTRKRLIFETFHLDVEGGVGERRTTPATSASQPTEDRGPQISASNAGTDSKESSAAVRITIEGEGTNDATQSDSVLSNSKEKPKKPKKRVGFQVERPDVYDF